MLKMWKKNRSVSSGGVRTYIFKHKVQVRISALPFMFTLLLKFHRLWDTKRGFWSAKCGFESHSFTITFKFIILIFRIVFILRVYFSRKQIFNSLVCSYFFFEKIHFKLILNFANSLGGIPVSQWKSYTAKKYIVTRFSAFSLQRWRIVQWRVIG